MLLLVVPPIVASVPAALLIGTWPEAIRGDMLGLAYALLGAGVILAAIVIVPFYDRLTMNDVPDGAPVTKTWLVIGPPGQSIAGIVALGDAADAVWPEVGRGLTIAGVAYGVLVWGFAMYWLAMALALTIRAKATHLPFDLSWWAFTFPVGVLVAGTDALYARTHARTFVRNRFARAPRTSRRDVDARCHENGEGCVRRRREFATRRPRERTNRIDRIWTSCVHDVRWARSRTTAGSIRFGSDREVAS